MATRPARPRPAQAQAAKPQSPKPPPTKTPPAKAEPPKAQSVKPQPAKPQPAKTQPSGPVAAPPRALRVAAVLEGVEAVGMLVAAGFAAVATAAGKSYELSSGIALTLIAVATAALFAAFAVGLARSRPWTRTPVVMFQLAIGFWGVFLLTGHKYIWGVPMLLLAAAILACVFTPAALRALNRPPRPS
jgi:hypothetical protein